MFSLSFRQIQFKNIFALFKVHSKAIVEMKRQMLKSKQKVIIIRYVDNKFYNSKPSAYLIVFQLVKMLMVVVTVYTLCYFPLNIVWVGI